MIRLQPLGEVRERLRAAALERGISPRDLDLLLGDLLGRPLAYILGHGEERIDPGPLLPLLQRRFDGEPLQYIRGKAEFFSREFLVDERVLIPRPETEIVVETALAHAPRGARVVDVGTGSGCIAISMERTRPDLRVIAVDVSVAALAVAGLNRRRLEASIELVASDIVAAFGSGIDLIVSNPPYIPEAEVDGLAAEVRQFEPRRALTPGPEGTEVMARILDQSRDRLSAGGKVVFEIAYGQLEQVRGVGRRAGFEIESVVPDLAGIARVVVLSRRGSE